MQLQTISKSSFKAKALEYMRLVEQSQQSIIITDMGNPVVQISPYDAKNTDVDNKLYALRGTLLEYENPVDPVGVEDWEALQ